VATRRGEEEMRKGVKVERRREGQRKRVEEGDERGREKERER
jgi:hypothetical protein